MLEQICWGVFALVILMLIVLCLLFIFGCCYIAAEGDDLARLQVCGQAGTR